MNPREALGAIHSSQPKRNQSQKPFTTFSDQGKNMANEKELIEEMFIQGLLEEESVNVRGIAQLAADKGYDHLTKPQQRVINHILTRACDGDRKSTRLNSSHVAISYAVF